MSLNKRAGLPPVPITNQLMNCSCLGLSAPCLAALVACGLALPSPGADSPKKVLVVTVTKGFRHSSIPTAEKVLGELGQKSGAFEVDYVRTDEDMAKKMTADAL